eukprot:COSAG02_NODE_30065_length_558_cov_0.457516_1_plen_36_part_01
MFNVSIVTAIVSFVINCSAERTAARAIVLYYLVKVS